MTYRLTVDIWYIVSVEEEEEGKRSGVQGLTGDIRGGFGGSFVDIENVLQFVFLDSVPHFESPSFMFCLACVCVMMSTQSSASTPQKSTQSSASTS